MVIIIDYGLGNLGSMLNMMEKSYIEAIVSADHKVIAKADKLILPGVGSFDTGMQSLAERMMIPLLNELVLEKKVPILGICLGMQLMSKKSEEGKMSGLGWLNAETIRFKLPDDRMKIPHMGWNQITVTQDHPLLSGLQDISRFYFVHSYHVASLNPANILATSHYGIDFNAVMVKENIMGVQFHPEKSHKFGMRLLNNFAELV